jgi:DNA helicase-2/ATP-dependent DNA helicase PcrA
VSSTDGPLLILAGAGSGKTRVITHRIARIIRDLGAPPSAVLAVTFTNKAAEEMRSRVAALLDGVNSPPRQTFSRSTHFVCGCCVRDGAPLAQVRPGFTRNFTIYDDEDQLAIIKSTFRQLGLDEKFMKFRAAISVISEAKNKKQAPQDFPRRLGRSQDGEARRRVRGVRESPAPRQRARFRRSAARSRALARS